MTKVLTNQDEKIYNRVGLFIGEIYMLHIIKNNNSIVSQTYTEDAEKISTMLLEKLQNISVINSLFNTVDIKFCKSLYHSRNYKQYMSNFVIDYIILDKNNATKLIHTFKLSLDFRANIEINSILISKLIGIILNKIKYELEKIASNRYSSIKDEKYKQLLIKFHDNLIKFCSEENN